MIVYKIVNKNGKFIKTFSKRKVWTKLNWLKTAINYRRKYSGNPELEDATVIIYELKEIARKSVKDYMKEGF
jgi:hypothetical protein